MDYCLLYKWWLDKWQNSNISHVFFQFTRVWWEETFLLMNQENFSTFNYIFWFISMFLYQTLINFDLKYETKYDSIVYTIKFYLRIFFSAIICILFSKKYYRIMQFSSLCMKTRLKSFEFKPLDMDHKPISYSLPPLIIVEIFGRKLAFFDGFFSGKWVSFLFSEYSEKNV